MKSVLWTTVFGGLFTLGAQAADLDSYAVQDDAIGDRSAVNADISIFGGLLNLDDYEDPEYNADGLIFGGTARANYWISKNFSAQVDISGEYYTADAEYQGDGYDVFSGNLALHLSSRNGNNLLGAFASVGVQPGGQDDDGIIKEYSWGWGSYFGTLGVEGQTFISPAVQLFGQAGVTTSFGESSFADDSADVLAYYLHGEARYFLKPDLMLAANAGGFYETYDGEVIHGVRWGADLESKFEGTPVSGFVSYQGRYEQEPNEPGYLADVVVNTVMAGLKLHINGGTLQSAATDGATLQDFNPLTGVNRSRMNDWE